MSKDQNPELAPNPKIMSQNPNPELALNPNNPKNIIKVVVFVFFSILRLSITFYLTQLFENDQKSNQRRRAGGAK